MKLQDTLVEFLVVARTQACYEAAAGPLKRAAAGWHTRWIRPTGHVEATRDYRVLVLTDELAQLDEVPTISGRLRAVLWDAAQAPDWAAHSFRGCLALNVAQTQARALPSLIEQAARRRRGSIVRRLFDRV